MPAKKKSTTKKKRTPPRYTTDSGHRLLVSRREAREEIQRVADCAIRALIDDGACFFEEAVRDLYAGEEPRPQWLAAEHRYVYDDAYRAAEKEWEERIDDEEFQKWLAMQVAYRVIMSLDKRGVEPV